VEALTFDLRWKAACGLAITDTAFDPSTLTYWRRRLAASKRPNRIFEVVAAVIGETGAVTGKTRRALDSTILDDAVARQDTVTQLIAAIRRVAREVPGADEIITGAATSGHDYSRPGKPQIAWDDPAARDELVSALVNDALAVLAGIEARHRDGAGLDQKAAEAVALLALVAGQDVEPAEGSDGSDGRWRIARQVAPDRMISTVDPDARHAHKTRERRQDGFKAHVVVEPDTGLITNTGLTKATGPDNSDANVGIALLQLLPRDITRVLANFAEQVHAARHVDRMLDSAIEDSFPASDPVALAMPRHRVEKPALRAAAESSTAAILPTSTQSSPYIHLDRDANGRITAIRQRREGDTMPSVGESDMGLFSLSPEAYFELLPEFSLEAAQASATRERNFLPFIPWLIRRGHQVVTFPSANELEAIGINTPDDRRRLEAYLRTLEQQ